MSEREFNPEEENEMVEVSNVDFEHPTENEELSKKIIHGVVDYMSSLTKKSNNVIQGEKMVGVLIERINSGTLSADEEHYEIGVCQDIIKQKTIDNVSQRNERKFSLAIVAVTIIAVTAIKTMAKK